MSYETEMHFKDLPQALVGELLSNYKQIGENLKSRIDRTQREKESIRAALTNKDLLSHESAILSSRVHPTTCGIDGAYTIDKLLATDIIVSAAVAVEGFTPPAEKRCRP
jgi:hypothetical protein